MVESPDGLKTVQLWFQIHCAVIQRNSIVLNILTRCDDLMLVFIRIVCNANTTSTKQATNVKQHHNRVAINLSNKRNNIEHRYNMGQRLKVRTCCYIELICIWHTVLPQLTVPTMF